MPAVQRQSPEAPGIVDSALVCFLRVGSFWSAVTSNPARVVLAPLRDSSDVFEYESLVHKTKSLQAELNARNDLIDQLERATTREVEEELTRHGKKATAAIQDAEARIAVAEKKLSSETRQRNAEQQETVARLKRERTDLVAFSELLQENRMGIDEFTTRLSATFGRLNALIEKLGLGALLALPGYEDRSRLDELLTTTETRLARVVTEIEDREKTIRSLTEDMRATRGYWQNGVPPFTVGLSNMTLWMYRLRSDCSSIYRSSSPCAI